MAKVIFPLLVGERFAYFVLHLKDCHEDASKMLAKFSMTLSLDIQVYFSHFQRKLLPSLSWASFHGECYFSYTSYVMLMLQLFNYYTSEISVIFWSAGNWGSHLLTHHKTSLPLAHWYTLKKGQYWPSKFFKQKLRCIQIISQWQSLSLANGSWLSWVELNWKFFILKIEHMIQYKQIHSTLHEKGGWQIAQHKAVDRDTGLAILCWF